MAKKNHKSGSKTKRDSGTSLRIPANASLQELEELAVALEAAKKRARAAKSAYVKVERLLADADLEWADLLRVRLEETPGEFEFPRDNAAGGQPRAARQKPTKLSRKQNMQFIHPVGAGRVYHGSGTVPGWLDDLRKKGHHILEFREDKPLRGKQWRNPTNPKDTIYRGEGPMPKWLVRELEKGRGREYILKLVHSER